MGESGRYRRRRRPLAVLILGVGGVWFLVTCVLTFLSNAVESSLNQGHSDHKELVGSSGPWKGRASHSARLDFYLLNWRGNNTSLWEGMVRRPLVVEEEGMLNCTPRSLDQFPGDFMTEEQRKDGGLVAHFLICIYIFAALAIVCDDYFVSSMEVICEALSLQSDVAGATFMAAGSSAPELFTSIIGVFLAKSDVGVGTIVGSAVFNILFIIAICGLGAGMVIYLTWWPMVRDCIFYTLSVVALVAVMVDEKIHWYESLVMIVMYIIYIIIMYFNPRLGGYLTHKVNTWKEKGKSEEPREDKPLVKDSNVKKYTQSQEQNAPLKRRRREDSLFGSQSIYNEEELDEYESPWTFPPALHQRIFWVVMLPVTFLLFFTIPDCRRSGCWRKLFMLTFTMSIIWIAGLSYLMVWMVSIIGDTLGIPDTVMGLTLLAAGTSIPDALASLFVARDGFGDMAVSNSIGSNVFDILIGLGLPWLLQTALVNPDSIVQISSGGLTFSAISLIGTVLFLLIAVALNKWRLNKVLGVICLVVYVIFMTFAVLYELNVFGEFNPPPCPREVTVSRMFRIA